MARQVMWPWRYQVPLVIEVASVAEAAEIPSELPVVPPAVVSTFQSCVQVPGVDPAVVITPYRTMRRDRWTYQKPPEPSVEAPEPASDTEFEPGRKAAAVPATVEPDATSTLAQTS